MQMLLESSFSFCTQQVTTRLHSGEAATAGEDGVNRTVARKSVGPHQLVVTMEDLAGPHRVPNRIFRMEARRQLFARRLLR
jgi:hypothetical protein